MLDQFQDSWDYSWCQYRSEFCKGESQMGEYCSLIILFIRVAFIRERLVSRFFHFKLSSTSTNVISHEKPVMTLPARFWIFAIYLSVAFHNCKYPIRGNSNQNKVVQVNCIRLQGCKAGQKVQLFSELLRGIQMNDSFLLNAVKPLLSGHLRDLPKCPLNRGRTPNRGL